MCSISKSEVRVLTGRDCDPCCVGVECLRFGTECRPIYYITESATVGDQQMIGSIDGGRYMGIFGYEPLVLVT